MSRFDRTQPPPLTRWQKFLALFGGETTWKWCVLVNTIGTHSAHLSLEECRDGVPRIAGGFLLVFPFQEKAKAEEFLVECKEIAERHNQSRPARIPA